MSVDYRQIDPAKMYFVGGGRNFGRVFKGVDPEAGLTTEEMLEQAGLNWTVEQRPIYHLTDHGYIEIGNRVANVRTDTEAVLGIVGNSYKPLQNRRGFEFADEIVQSGSAGWIGGSESLGGARVQALMRLNRDIKIGGLDDEQILPLLSFRNGHDGGLAVTVGVAPFRGACLNGMMLAIKGAARQWKIRHVGNINAKVDEARRTLDLAFTYYDELEELGNKLVAQKMSEKAFAAFMDQLIPYTPVMEKNPDSRTAKNREEAVEAITALFQKSPNLENVRGTAWAALQAVGEYDDWTRKINRKDENKKQELRLTRATSPSKIKDRALEILV